MSSEVKEQIIGFLMELDDEAVVRRYMSRTITRDEMIQEIRDGTEEGNRYCTDLLRISRDMIARRAAKQGDEPSPGMRI